MSYQIIVESFQKITEALNKLEKNHRVQIHYVNMIDPSHIVMLMEIRPKRPDCFDDPVEHPKPGNTLKVNDLIEKHFGPKVPVPGIDIPVRKKTEKS